MMEGGELKYVRYGELGIVRKDKFGITPVSHRPGDYKEARIGAFLCRDF